MTSAASLEDSTNSSCKRLYIDTLVRSCKRGIIDVTKVEEDTCTRLSRLSFSAVTTAVINLVSDAIGTATLRSLAAKIDPFSTSAIK